MADGPLDYGSGYIFESQKGISDRQAARGHPPGPGDAGRGSGSTRDSGVAGDSGSLVAGLLLGFGFISWKIAEVVIPLILWLVWEAIKLTAQILIAALGGNKRR